MLLTVLALVSKLADRWGEFLGNVSPQDVALFFSKTELLLDGTLDCGLDVKKCTITQTKMTPSSKTLTVAKDEDDSGLLEAGPGGAGGGMECSIYQNYGAAEVLVQGMAGMVDQRDVEAIIRAQKKM